MKNLIDAHTHSVASGHAFSSIKENFDAAIKQGLKYYGISDHAPKMPGSTHKYYFSNLICISSKYQTLCVLKGAELNILDEEGTIDLSEKDLKALDYTVASLHHPCFVKTDQKGNTKGIINAMHNPYVKIIGHPDDSRFPLDYEQLVLAAKKNHVLLEVNNRSLLPTSFREGAKENYTEMLKLCMKYEVPIICNSDAHIESAVGDIYYAFNFLKEINFPSYLIVNFNEELIKEYIIEKKQTYIADSCIKEI